jgi:hypothetical protein
VTWPWLPSCQLCMQSLGDLTPEAGPGAQLQPSVQGLWLACSLPPSSSSPACAAAWHCVDSPLSHRQEAPATIRDGPLLLGGLCFDPC